MQIYRVCHGVVGPGISSRSAYFVDKRNCFVTDRDTRWALATMACPLTHGLTLTGVIGEVSSKDSINHLLVVLANGRLQETGNTTQLQIGTSSNNVSQINASGQISLTSSNTRHVEAGGPANFTSQATASGSLPSTASATQPADIKPVAGLQTTKSTTQPASPESFDFWKKEVHGVYSLRKREFIHGA